MTLPLPVLAGLAVVVLLSHVRLLRDARRARQAQRLASTLTQQLTAERAEHERYRDRWAPLIDAHCQAIGAHFAGLGFGSGEFPALTAHLPPFYTE